MLLDFSRGYAFGQLIVKFLWYNVKMKKFILIIILITLFRCSESKKQELSDFVIPDTLCVSSHLKTEGDYSSQKIRTEELRLLSSAGVKYLRRDFLWHEIEPAKGNFDFSGYDRIVDEARNYGMEFIGLLAYGNNWASEASKKCVESGMSGCTNYPPDKPEDFGNFVFHTVSHFKDRVHFWEIWNEPNFGINFFKPFSDPKKYSEILKAGYTSTKLADPRAIVSFGGVLMPDYEIEPSGIEFLQDVMKAMPEPGNYFDAFSFHPYMYPYPPSIPPEQDSSPSQGSIITMIDSVYKTITDLKISSMPLWITEIGWPTYESVSETVQAAYLIRSLLLSLVKGIEIYCWYTTYDGDGSSFPPAEDYFGLISYFEPSLNSTPMPKLSYYALKNLYGLAKNFYILQNYYETEFPDTYKIKLISKDTQEEIYVLWSISGDDKNIEIELNGSVASVVDLFGEQISTQIQDNKLVVKVSWLPVYIILKKS